MRPSLYSGLIFVLVSSRGIRGGVIGARDAVEGILSEYLTERRGIPLSPHSGSQGLNNGDGDDAAAPLRRRQTGGTDGMCGEGVASCAEGYCCSDAGWCGTTEEYCAAPDCQINYGSGCDANQKPSGVDTSTIARPKLGKVLYGGAGIYDCEKDGDIAITFDDGPYLYTGDLLDKLAAYGAHATFFITGNNLGKGMINDLSRPWAGYIKRMINEGHQVASHTWSHQNASELTAAQFTDQMIWNEIALNDLLGFFPTYMRPPYSICDEGVCQDVLWTLGYHAVYFDLDTEGYLHDDPDEIQRSKDIWDEAMERNGGAAENNSFLQIEHDIHWQSVYNLTEYFLASLLRRGYRSVTVGECLGDPVENWYRAGSGVVPTAIGSVAPSSSAPASTSSTTMTTAKTNTTTTT